MEELNTQDQQVDNLMTGETGTPAGAPQTQETVNAENESHAEENARQTPAEEPVQFVEPQVDYSDYERERLVEAFSELLEQDVSQVKNRVASIKNVFTEKTKVAEEQALADFLNGGGSREDYKPSEDPLNEEFKKLSAEYSRKRKQHKADEEAEKLRNLEMKKDLLEQLKKLNESEESLKKIYDEFNSLQERWKGIGDVPRTEINDLWQTYHFLIDQFYSKVKIIRELKDNDMRRNLEQKIELCEKAEELIMETSVNKAFKQMQEYRSRWKEIGPVPSDKNEEIWNRFCNAMNQIDARRREHYEQMKDEQEKNLMAKTALCEKAEELLAELPATIREWTERTDAMNELLKIWKTIGPVPREMNDEIWDRFRGSMSKFFDEKKEYMDKAHSEQTENYNRKVEICVKAESIAQRTDWKHATEDLLKLQEEWKTIGSTSKKLSDKVWTRFRAACDDFFARKSEYYAAMRSSENENLAKKQEILEKVKAFQITDDKDADFNALKEFQRQWLEIGFVPADKKDQLQKDFSETINVHFNNLKVSAREAQEEIYRERIKSISGNSRIVNEERAELQDKIQKLKSDVTLWENNLGFLANSKQADLLKQEFEKKIQNTRQQIALLEAKLKIVSETQKNGD